MNIVQLKMLIGSALYDGSVIKEIKSYKSIKELLAELKLLDPDYYSDISSEIVTNLSKYKNLYLVLKELPSGSTTWCIFTDKDFKRNKYLKKVQSKIDKLLSSKEVIDIDTKCKVIGAKVFSNIYEVTYYADNQVNYISNDEVTRFINLYGVKELDYIVVLTLDTKSGITGHIVASESVNDELAIKLKLFSIMSSVKSGVPTELQSDFNSVVNYFSTKPNLSYYALFEAKIDDNKKVVGKPKFLGKIEVADSSTDLRSKKSYEKYQNTDNIRYYWARICDTEVSKKSKK